MSAEILADKVRAMTPGYETMFAGRGGVTPTDPLQFHFYHLARYWSRLLGFCALDPSKPASFIDGDLGACIQVGSEFAHRLIGPNSPIYASWQIYWTQARAVLHQRPITLDAVKAASRAFEVCVTELKYDPWGNTVVREKSK